MLCCQLGIHAGAMLLITTDFTVQALQLLFQMCSDLVLLNLQS